MATDNFGGVLVKEPTPKAAPKADQFGGKLVDQPKPEKEGFLDRVGKDLAKRGGEVMDTLRAAGIDTDDPLTVDNATKLLEKAGGLFLPISPSAGLDAVKDIVSFASDELGPSETRLQLVGKGVAGPAADAIGEGIISTINGISSLIGKDASGKVKKGLTDLAKTNAGKVTVEAVTAVSEAFKEFSKDNPRAAKNIESLVNIGLFMTPVKAKGTPTPLGKATTAINKTASAQRGVAREKFVAGLVSPRKTQKQATKEALRSEVKGKFFKKNVVTPTKLEAEVAREVGRTNGVTANKTMQENLNAIIKANDDIGVNLEKALGANKTKVPPGAVEREIDEALEELIRSTPLIFGDAERVARGVAENAKRVWASHPNTPLGILKARQEVDRLAKAQKKTIFAEDAANSAAKDALKAVRTAMNNSLEIHAVTVPVKRMLTQRSRLFKAAENIAPKIAAETMAANKQASLETIVRLATSGIKRIEVLAKGTGRAAKGLVAGPTTKNTIASLIEVIDKAILSGTNPSLLRTLRADKAALKEIADKMQKEE